MLKPGKKWQRPHINIYKKNMKKLFIIYLLLLYTGISFAQEKTTDLQTLINQSFSYFPAFKELHQGLDIAQQQISLVKSSGLPTAQATGSYRYLHPVSEISIPTGADPVRFQIMPNNNYSTTVNASYTLWDFGVVKAGVERAKADLRAAEDHIAFTRNQMAFQVGSIYYQMAYLKEAIDIQDSVLYFLEANKRDTEIKFNNGDALKYDVLSIQSGIDQENNRKIDLQNSLNKQFALMEYATGIKVSTSTANFDFPEAAKVNLEGALQAAQNNHPEFKLAKDRIVRAEAEVNLSKTNGKPSLSVNAGTGFMNGYAPEIDKFRYNYSAGLTLNIPIYQSGRAKKQVRLAQSQLVQTQLLEETLSNAYRKDIQQAILDIGSNESSMMNAARQINEAKEAQKLAQSRYRNGIGTNLELTNASTNVQRAQLTRLQYVYQLCLSKLTLAKLTGVQYW